LSDFAGYARTNLFAVKDVEAFWADIVALNLPVSRLDGSDLVGVIWTGSGTPFTEDALKQLSQVLKAHASEPVFVIVAGSVRGEMPLLECTVIDPMANKITRNTLQDITKGREVNLSPASVIWKP
jgi:hypothetical protein